MSFFNVSCKDFVFCFFEKEQVSKAWVATGDRGGEAQTASIPRTEPNKGLDLTTLRSGPEPESRDGRSTDYTTQVPQDILEKI